MARSHFHLRAETRETLEKVQEIFGKTRILKRQLELALGQWDFVVFGPQGKDHSVIREGCAVHMRIQNALVYVAAVGDPAEVGGRGMPIEEFTRGDIPPELKDLEIYQIDPLRPLTIHGKRPGPHPSEAVDRILEEFSSRNIAIIETPEERYWSISVLRYLHECDQYFPDRLTEALKRGDLPRGGFFFPELPGFH